MCLVSDPGPSLFWPVEDFWGGVDSPGFQEDIDRRHWLWFMIIHFPVSAVSMPNLSDLNVPSCSCTDLCRMFL